MGVNYVKSTWQHGRQKNETDHQFLVQTERTNNVQLRIKIHRAFWMQAARPKSESKLDLLIIIVDSNRVSDDSDNYSIGHFAIINSEFPTARCCNSTRVSCKSCALWEAFNKPKCCRFLNFYCLLFSF